MAAMPYGAVVFDLFGTLLDVGSLRDVVAPYAPDPASFVATWREKQLAYAFASAIVGAHEDFDRMTEYGLRYAAAKHGVTLDDAAAHTLIAAWETMQPYADALPALRTLRAAGIACGILTNGTPVTSARAIAAAGMRELLDEALSVEIVGIYKPDRRVYALATERYAARPAEIAFVTSNGWDATGAAAFGLSVAWCNRLNAPHETFGPRPTWTIASLSELPALVLAKT